jgi:AcrR family transcriptional regulator
MQQQFSIYQEQENLILQAAAKCIEASSLLDFTMAAISSEAGLSMGSIYKHIQSKEDVLVALGYRSHIHFETMACTVLALPLPIAARIVAVQLVDRQHTSPYSFGSQLITLLGNEAILRRASPGWLEKYIARDIAVEKLFQQQLLEAANSGELAIDAANRDAVLGEIMTAIWSLCVGHTQVTRQRNARSLLDATARLEPDSIIVRALQRLMNTYAWRTPMSDALLEQTCRTLVQHGLR